MYNGIDNDNHYDAAVSDSINHYEAGVTINSKLLFRLFFSLL